MERASALQNQRIVRKRKRELSLTVGYVLLLLGLTALVFSILFTLSVLALVGLGITFWGSLLLFIKPVRYVKSSLLDSTTLSLLTTINQVIEESNSKGKAIYLPPKHLEEIRSGKVFISYEKGSSVPPPENVAEEKVFSKNPKGMCFTPPGVALVNLFEDLLGTSFTKVEVNYLQDKLPRLFIEDLEIAEDLEINVKGSNIHLRIVGSTYRNLCKQARNLSNICGSLGCPLCSSFACALARATGKPIIIEKTEPSEDGETVEAYYRVIQE